MLSLAHGLDRTAYDLTVVLPEHLASSISAFRQLGIQVVPLPLRKVAWRPEAITSYLRLVREQGFDVVHIHSQEAGLVARPLARLAGAKAILYTPQTIDIARARWQWLYRLAERLLASITGRIVSVNEADRRRLISWGIPPAKIVTIPNGIDLAPFAQPAETHGLRNSLGLDLDRPLVMQMGRLRTQKDPLAFVEGAAEVARQCPDAQFALLGDGPLRDEVTARIRKLGLERSVRCLGWHDHGYRLLAAADVISLTSLWEGTPFTLLEAMAWSRPVVATAVNGCPEIVVDGITGFLVPPDDPAAWARRVIELLDSPAQARTMGRQGRKRLEERFTVQHMIAQVETLYRNLSQDPAGF